jgi:2,4-dienoyl-CoA reductase-like NADH-dependent reductase (Old Yellow Enzyme family)
MGSKLFSEIKVGNLNLQNRIVIPPMCQYSASEGLANEWHLFHYGNLAFSGAGLLIFEATAVEPEGRITHADLGLWDEKTAAALRRVVDFIRLHCQTPLALQISHAGRKASTHIPWQGGKHIPFDQPMGWQTFSPSETAQSTGDSPPKELSTDEIEAIIENFARTAKLAVEIGFDAIEIHAAHGYLIHQFLSPITNNRSDNYGGSFENRIRFVIRILEAIKEAVTAKFTIGIRISATDWIKGGWDLPQSIALSNELKKRGISYIHVSSGGLDNGLQQLPPLAAGYQLPFAEAIRKEVEVPIIGVGLISEPKDAEKAIADEKADLIAIGRAALFDPRWAWHAAAILEGKVEVPPQYLRSVPHQFKGIFG